jgi:hypothetical protein
MVTLPGLRWHGGSRGVRDREEVSKARGRSSARRISCVYGAAFSAEGLQGLVRDDQHLVSDGQHRKSHPGRYYRAGSGPRISYYGPHRRDRFYSMILFFRIT